MFDGILSPTHLLFILVVALLVLGPKRLPEVGRSLGKTLRDFRGAMSGVQEEFNAATNLTGETPANTPAATAPADTAVAPAAQLNAAPAGAATDGELVRSTPFQGTPSVAATPVAVASVPVASVSTEPEAVQEQVFGVPAMPEPTPARAVVHEPAPSEYSD